MPWKPSGAEKKRREFVDLRCQRSLSMKALCRRFGISRECGYKWWRRFREEGPIGLSDRKRTTKSTVRLGRRWQRMVTRLRGKYPDWGAAKLQWLLRRRHGKGPWPSVSTVGRWLAATGLTQRRACRTRPGPSVPPQPRLVAMAANDVWTIDFKGAFYTANRRRVNALTVRDLATRYLLAVCHVRPTEREVAKIMQQLFRRYGLPKAIRSDNGPPFGSSGPRGWTPLTISWVQKGIRVDFGRPACPQDNAAHEQMHGVLKKATAKPPALTLAAQQRRFAYWRRQYNSLRPHESLGLRPPAELYLPIRSTAPRLSWRFPAHCKLTRLDARGRIRWHERTRHIGRAFAQQLVGLKPKTNHVWEIYFGPHLLGTLHRDDSAGLRPVQWRKLKSG